MENSLRLQIAHCLITVFYTFIWISEHDEEDEDVDTNKEGDTSSETSLDMQDTEDLSLLGHQIEQGLSDDG